MKFKPQGEFMLVKELEQADWDLVGSIAIPTSNDIPPIGEIMDMSEGLKANMNKMFNLKVGDQVMFKKTNVIPVEIDKVEYWLVHYAAILAVVSEIPKSKYVPTLKEIKAAKGPKRPIAPSDMVKN